MFLLVSLPALKVKTPKLLLITPLLQHSNSRSTSVFSVVHTFPVIGLSVKPNHKRSQ